MVSVALCCNCQRVHWTTNQNTRKQHYSILEEEEEEATYSLEKERMMSSPPSHYINAGEHRQRHARPIISDESSCAAAGNLDTTATAATYCSKHKRHRRLKQRKVERLLKQCSKPSAVLTQTVALLMLFTALLNLWHDYMRTVNWWQWPHIGRLAQQRHARSLTRNSLYQIAQERIREIHELNSREKNESHEDMENRDNQRIQARQEKQRLRLHEKLRLKRKQELEMEDDKQFNSPQEQQQEMDMLSELSAIRLQDLFQQERQTKRNGSSHVIQKILTSWRDKIDRDIINNVHGGIRWTPPYLLPPLPAGQEAKVRVDHHVQQQQQTKIGSLRFFFEARRATTAPLTIYQWQEEWEEMLLLAKSTNTNGENLAIDQQTTRIARKLAQPIVDYTSNDKYRYPHPLLEKP